ncbi:MAG: hypothetical protein QOH72_3089 [Solirubrobacteraceae bacterium]|jgi:hypothetical protein|nr:hypothetical protein [Solirubrobacteraceae bacterium]
MAKDKAPQKAKKPKGPAVPSTAISVSAHPRAAYSIRRTKGWGGLIGLVLVGWFSYRAGLMPVDAALRALVGGIVGYVACWTISVQVWRHLVIAEARAAAERVRQASAARAGATAAEPGR